MKKTVNVGGKSVVLRADRNLFTRLVVIGQSRQVNLRDLTHELGPIPWSLFLSDGTLAKTTKSVLTAPLEDDVEAPQSLPDYSVLIIDAMVLLQTMTRIPDRFEDLVELILSTVFKLAGEAKRIDFVADQYPLSLPRAQNTRKEGRPVRL